MSNSPFDTITARYLAWYDRRQRTLMTTGGLFWTICLAIALLLACVLLDWLVVLPDAWLWSISTVCYVVVFAAAGFFCMRPLLLAGDRRTLAIDMERAEPMLRHRLLSVVELHAADGASAGSPRLREISQQAVAAQIQSINIPRLLPVSQLKRSGPSAVLAVSLLAIIALLPESDFGHRITRILLPGANLGRISQTFLSIESPSPESGTVPADETTRIAVRVSGKIPETVHLQYRSSGTDMRQPMIAQEEDHYAINLPVGSDRIEYRIFGGDSITPWHILDPRKRPSITSFEKTIHHPDYAHLDASFHTDPSGDIEALEGSTAEIDFVASAPLSSADLTVQWDDGDPEPWQLQQLEPNRYRMSLPVKQSGSYKIALVDTETGFDNPFLPSYRIHSIEDLPPQIALIDAPSKPLLLPAADLLPFEMRVRDELPLATVGYEVSINEGEWKRTPLELSDDEPLTFSEQLDLMPYGLNVGDSVRLRGVAIDRKGQSGLTSTVEIIIDSERYDPGTRDAILNRLAWARAVKEWTTAVQEATQATTEELESLLKDKPADQVQIVGNIDTAPLRSVVEASDKVIRHSIAQLPDTKDPIAAAQLEGVGRLVDVVQADLREWIVSVSGERPDAPDPQLANQLRQSLNRLADNAKKTEEYVPNFVGFDLALAYTGDIYGLIGLLDSFQPESADHSPWRRLYRYSTLTSNRLMALDSFLAETSNHLPARSQNLTTGLRTWLNDRQHRLDEILEATDENDSSGKEDALRRLLVDLRRELGDRTNTGAQDGHLHQITVDGRRDLERRSGGLHREISLLGDKLQQVAKASQAMIGSKDATDVAQAERAWLQARTDAERSARDLPVRLRRWATLHQLRPDADARYAADAGLASRAIESVLSLPDGSSELRNAEQEPATRDQVIKLIASDYQVLEAGHRLTQALGELEELVQSERWSRNRIVRRFELPLRWDSHLNGIEDTTTALRDAKTDGEIHNPVAQTRWEVPQSAISQALSERRWNRDADLPVFRQMQDVHAKLAEPHEKLLPVMDAARARIAAYVPSIPQLAKDAADSLDADAEDAQSDAAAAEAFREQMQRLIDALVQHANLADVSTFEGIRQARDADAAIEALKAAEDTLESAQAEADAQISAVNPEQLASSPERQRAEQQLDDAQQRTLDLLKMVQQHFASDAQTDSQQDAAARDDRLLTALRDAGLERQSDQRFRALEQMAQANAKSPQDLLKELEAELQRNPDMQNALSDISQRAAEGVRETLAKTANEQASMQRGIESADSDLRDSKKPIVQALGELADRASEMERTLVQQAENAASRGAIPEIHQRLREQRQQLGQVASKARSVNDDSLLADIRQTAQQVAESLGEVSRQIKTASDEAGAKQDSPAEEDENKRRNLANALQDENRRMRDGRIRDAENRLKAVEREVAGTEQKVRNQENSLKQTEDQVRQAEQRANQNPENEQLKRALAQSVQRQQQAQQQVNDAKAAENAAKEKRGRFEEAVAAANQTPQSELNAANPAAQAAKELAATAAQLADQLSQAAHRAAEGADPNAAPAPPENHLRNAETQQQLVQQQVKDASRDLARSARHEARLNKSGPAEQLSTQAQKIAQTARNEVATAEQGLQGASEAAHQWQQAAAAAAENSGDSPPDAAAAEATAQTAARQSAVAARGALQQSEQALRQRQQEMESLLGTNDPGSSNAASRASDEQAANDSPGPGSPAQGPTSESMAGPVAGQGETVAGLQDPQVMAQTLDQLDQQIAAGSEQSPAAADSNGQPRNAPSSEPGSFASRLQSEARAQGRQLAQQRTSAQQPFTASPSQTSDSPSGLVSNNSGPGSPDETPGRLSAADRRGDSEWGALKKLTIGDAADAGTDSLNRAYRRQLEAYFRVLAERSRDASSSAAGP